MSNKTQKKASNTNMYQNWWETEVAQKIISNKYFQPEEKTFFDFLDRVVAPFNNLSVDLKEAIINADFVPAGSILAGAGVEEKRKLSLSNCYILPSPEDDLESIFNIGKDMGRTFSRRGGCGINLSKLRPRGSKVFNSSRYSTGVSTFVKYYNDVCSTIGAEGRRAALLIALSCTHPDIEEFLTVKTNNKDIQMANLSIFFTDDFMRAVVNKNDFELNFVVEATGEKISKTINAHEFFMEFSKAQYDWAEPGALFIDHIKNYNLLSGYPKDKYNIECCNPCFTGDTKLLTIDGYKTFEELCGKEVNLINFKNNITKGKVWCNGEKETVQVTFENGDIIKCTPDHIFMVKNYEGYKEVQAKDLVGELVIKRTFTYEHNKSKYFPTNYIKVKSIKNIGINKVYDFTEPEIHWGLVNGGYAVHNCAEYTGAAYNACSLSSINLYNCVKNPFTKSAEFDYDKFKILVDLGVRVLDMVLDIGYDKQPLQENKDAIDKWRAIGLGTFGLADMFVALGIRYGSEESVQLVDNIYKEMLYNALLSSSNLAIFEGSFEGYDYDKIQNAYILNSLSKERKKEVLSRIEKNGLRNGSLLSIAPTGTIATMLGLSGGVEPYYKISYERTTHTHANENTGVTFRVFAKAVDHLMKKNKLTKEKELPVYVVSTLEINPIERINVQAAMQKYVDNSISSTINLKESATVQDIYDTYINAWQSGCKGITVFRENCKRLSILGDNKTLESVAAQSNKLNHIKPITRSNIKRLDGSTISKSTACVPKMYITVNMKDESPFEVFVNASQGCKANISTITRLISLLLRSGVSVENVIQELKENTCQACVTLRGQGKLDKSLSCGTAIAEAIAEMIEYKDPEKENMAPCPECGEKTLIPQGKCYTCTNCFYTKCE